LQLSEENSINYYTVGAKGGRIGRHSQNSIVVADECVSRFHAEVVQKENEFFLQDLGSTTGTFLKVASRVRLSLLTVFEIGSNQFQVHKLDDETRSLGLIVLDGQSAERAFLVNLRACEREVCFIGRKASN